MTGGTRLMILFSLLWAALCGYNIGVRDWRGLVGALTLWVIVWVCFRLAPPENASEGLTGPDVEHVLYPHDDGRVVLFDGEVPAG